MHYYSQARKSTVHVSLLYTFYKFPILILIMNFLSASVVQKYKKICTSIGFQIYVPNKWRWWWCRSTWTSPHIPPPTYILLNIIPDCGDRPLWRSKGSLTPLLKFQPEALSSQLMEGVAPHTYIHTVCMYVRWVYFFTYVFICRLLIQQKTGGESKSWRVRRDDQDCMLLLWLWDQRWKYWRVLRWRLYCRTPESGVFGLGWCGNIYVSLSRYR